MKRQGFTIVELLIVIVVIGILAAITIVAFTGVQARARDAERASEAQSIYKAIEMYRADNGAYPLHSGGNNNQGYTLTAISSLLVPKYLPQLPADPKDPDTTYQYVRDSGTDSFAIRIMYESRTQCRLGVNDESKTWWNAPKC